MMPRFVLLYHECPVGFIKPSHWDFMLEVEGVLRTWALPELPSSWQTEVGATQTRKDRVVVAKQLPDHRLSYLSFEGLLTEDRGSVKRVAEGTFQEVKANETCLTVLLQGRTITGQAILNRVRNTDEWNLTTAD